MANLVARLLQAMKLVESSSVVFINNSLELLGSYVGQTPVKVDDKVNEAKGGIIFIDEAYSIVKEGGSREGASFGKEAIDTIMKHLDPPSCVFIFAGYQQEMEDFLKVNPGLARRIPYRFTFSPYPLDDLLKIFVVMCTNKGESLTKEAEEAFIQSLAQLDPALIAQQNAGLLSNFLSFSQMERDDRLSVREAELNPELASLLEERDLLKAVEKVRAMNSAENALKTAEKDRGEERRRECTERSAELAEDFDRMLSGRPSGGG